MNLEPVIQSEINQKEENKYCILTHRKSGFNPLIGKIPWRKEWLPIPVFLPGESHKQRGLAGYSPQGWKQLNTTERLTPSYGIYKNGTDEPICRAG